ncbi:Uncharacterised protein [Bordetella pertussis]|nr:Uncharacterised protein [Bordetella pertussis]
MNWSKSRIGESAPTTSMDGISDRRATAVKSLSGSYGSFLNRNGAADNVEFDPRNRV